MTVLQAVLAVAVLLWSTTAQTAVTTIATGDGFPSEGRLGDVSVDARGAIYVSNFARSVWRIDLDGTVTELVGNLQGTSGNVILADGTLLQTSYLENRIVAIDAAGSISEFAQGVAGPVDLDQAPDESLWVTQCKSNSVVHLDANGASIETVTSDDFDCPSGIAVKENGEVFVGNFRNGHVLRIQPGSGAEHYVDVPGGGGGRIAGLGDNLFVTGVRSNRVFRVDGSGSISVLAGTGEYGVLDGPAEKARLAAPGGLAVARTRDGIFVNDLIGPWRAGRRVRMILRHIDLPYIYPVATREVLRGPTVRGEQARRIDARLKSIDGGRFSGALLVARGDDVVLHVAYGLRDRERHLPFVVDSSSKLMSITKSLVAVAIFLEREQGRVALTDDLGHLLGFAGDHGDITVADLLMHTSGLPERAPELDRESVRAFVSSIAELELAYSPGSVVSYSNPGYGLAAIVAEQQAGVPLTDYLQTYVWYPASDYFLAYLSNSYAWQDDVLALVEQELGL